VNKVGTEELAGTFGVPEVVILLRSNRVEFCSADAGDDDSSIVLLTYVTGLVTPTLKNCNLYPTPGVGGPKLNPLMVRIVPPTVDPFGGDTDETEGGVKK